MYIAAGQGQTTPGDKMLMSTETSCSFGHLLQVSKNLFEVLILYNFFLNMYIAPRQVLTTPWEQILYVNRNILFSHLLQVSKKSLKSDFIQFFHDFIHVYSPRTGGDSPKGTKF